MASNSTLPADYWSDVQITSKDLEALQNHLFEVETPLTVGELAEIFVRWRLKYEVQLREQRRRAAGRRYLPREVYSPGEELVFPALDWKQGVVVGVRAAVNPELSPFQVITVRMEGGANRMFASALEQHDLNTPQSEAADGDTPAVQEILDEHGDAIEARLQTALTADPGLVRIAGRWFPRGLLVDVGEGQLNLAEAVLDMAQGEPQPTPALLKDVELPSGINPKLAEFSLNRALQDDPRFDEVGPAGQVLWSLQRLEPDGVREVPMFLRYTPIDYDHAALDGAMRDLDAEVDDELSEASAADSARHDINEVTISLIYPHLRAGTLPLSARARSLLPTAWESPRVRFTLVDARSGIKMPAWIVRAHGYAFGLREWYKSHALIPGSLVSVRKGKMPGEVIVEAKTQRSSKDWIRTVIVGADGGLVFAMLKQPITAEFNDRMAIYVADFHSLDPLWEKKRPLVAQLEDMMRELSKVNPQGHVHAQEIYAAMNLVRRVPPAPLLAALASNPRFVHVGDLHFRLEEAG
jgi:hypothetical protein